MSNIASCSRAQNQINLVLGELNLSWLNDIQASILFALTLTFHLHNSGRDSKNSTLLNLDKELMMQVEQNL